MSESSQTAGVGSMQRSRPQPLRAVARMLGHVVLVACWLLVAIMAALTWGPHLAHFKTDVIVGQSMEPTIPLYSVTVVEDVQPDHLRVGDIIVFNQPDIDEARKVTHRIQRVTRTKQGGISFITKGDNNEFRDPWVVSYSDMGYRVTGHVPRVGWLMIKAQSRVARIALIVVPVLMLLMQFLRWIWRNDERAEADFEAESDASDTLVPWDDWEYVQESDVEGGVRAPNRNAA